MNSVFDLKHILTALLVPLLVILTSGGFYINFLRQRYMGQYIREDGPESHQSKAGTPTMGGLLILVGVALGLFGLILIDSATLSIYTWLLFLVTFVFGAMGAVDDYLKISKKKNKGLSGYSKLAIQLSLGMAVGLYLFDIQHIQSTDFFGRFHWNLGLFYPLFTALVITGTSNAVNLTDGLDGLASSNLVISFLAMAALLYNIQQYHLALFALVLAAACAGFLWFNKHPARIFMGDTGSLALGGALGTLAVLGGIELWLLLIGGIYVAEAL